VPHNEKLAARVREDFAARGLAISEIRMFGGIAFLVGGNMSCGIVDDSLMVRVGPDHYEALLAKPHARPMDFTGKPMRGFLYVDPAGFRTRAALAAWIERALAFTSSLPEKATPAKPAAKKSRSVKKPAAARRR
jgi:TfoX/Sxy family transcriptional regulator of competence genes